MWLKKPLPSARHFEFRNLCDVHTWILLQNCDRAYGHWYRSNEGCDFSSSWVITAAAVLPRPRNFACTHTDRTIHTVRRHHSVRACEQTVRNADVKWRASTVKGSPWSLHIVIHLSPKDTYKTRWARDAPNNKRHCTNQNDRVSLKLFYETFIVRMLCFYYCVLSISTLYCFIIFFMYCLISCIYVLYNLYFEFTALYLSFFFPPKCCGLLH